ncbi:MAG: Hpt domain-containing protein [Mariprofundus sp.]|nr:Hpt domain-containing protein [Mariprofundus sp.]
MNILDTEVLQLLPGDAQMLQKILNVFLKSSEKLMVMMEEGVENSNMDQIAHAAHTLKSSSAMVGAMDLSELCQQIEAAMHDDECSRISVMVQQSRHARQLVESECHSLYLK